MPVVLQIGQCGNQLGSKFFSTYADVLTNKKSCTNFDDDAYDRFFSQSECSKTWFPRAVLIDTEPKVIQQTLLPTENSQPWQYRDNSYFVKEEGSGNNWAMGYFEHGKSCQEAVLDLIRKEVERCDILDGFLMFVSVAGGTGSGLGTYITEMLKDEFSSVPIMNQLVWPFNKGEVTVQSYNAALTLSHLQENADAISVMENEQLYKICTQRLGMKDVQLSDLNTVATRQLTSLFLPSKSSSSIIPQFADLLAHLVPHAQFKLLNVRSVPQEISSLHSFSFQTWQSLLRSLRRMVLYNTVVDEVAASGDDTRSSSIRSVSLANLLLLRGLDAPAVDTETLHKPSLPYAPWVPSICRLQTWTHTAPIFNQERTATLVNNGQLLIPCIDAMIAKSWKMYNHKAYLHHFLPFGMAKDDFIECFAELEQIVANYKELPL